MTETNMPLIELLQKHDEGDFLRAVTEAVLQTLMEHDVEGMIGAGRYARGEARQTYRNGYRDRELKTRMWYASRTVSSGNGNLRDSDPFLSRDLYEYTPGTGQYATANLPVLVGAP